MNSARHCMPVLAPKWEVSPEDGPWQTLRGIARRKMGLGGHLSVVKHVLSMWEAPGSTKTHKAKKSGTLARFHVKRILELSEINAS